MTATATAARRSTCASQTVSAFGVKISILFTFLILMVKGTSGDEQLSALSKEVLKTSFRPSTLVIYEHTTLVGPNATQVISATPSRSRDATGIHPGNEFGSISVLATNLREDEDRQSPVIGRFVGQSIVLNDLSIFIMYTAVITTDLYSGTISAQGHLDQQGGGEMAVVGGTGDFLGARGYVEDFMVSRNPETSIFKNTFHLTYD